MAFNLNPATDFMTGYFVCLQSGSNFIPLFMVPPIYCLSQNAAQALLADLATDLGAPLAIVQDNPEGPNFSFYVVKNFFGVSDKVPFLSMTGASGKKFEVNAGLVANWFNHGYDPAYAHAQAVADLKAQIAAN